MGNQVVIFDASQGKKSGYVFISKRTSRASFRKHLGVFFIFLCLTGVVLLVFPVAKEEVRYRLGRSEFSLILSPNDNQFELIIPKMGIKTQVLIDVDPADEQEYKTVLADKAAHAKGSSLPGKGSTIYIFGHSTNSIFNSSHYNPVFYRLKELSVGDELAIIYQGEVYIYKVAEKKVVQAPDLGELTPNLNQEKLILQTCWPPGTTWKRLLVIAYPERKS